ncbi:unnamed protein product [Acanthoscelides obtectus]|uniref:DDE Tnp4 domain-containing protein n=1 Tax=Acanthoscelides obtectus TaxID=200917 RepID=A0A9P0PXX5_ACAOB|nr:unnamed protein product [Acanthoscelides obtectus]CAK1680570.1 hypothetical protein AOBTE_LOCUS32769 [Acanthoscelides obtectus]
MNWNLMTNKKTSDVEDSNDETLQEDEIIDDDCSSTSEQEYVPSDHEEEDSELEMESVDQDSNSSRDNVQSDHLTGLVSYKGKNGYIWKSEEPNKALRMPKHIIIIVVLMALVNSNYEFVYVDVGKQGRLSYGGVISSTKFYDMLVKDELQFPNNDENDEKLNFVIVGDEAFALHEHILKPFSHRNLTNERRIYNYRISRCRNVVENAFGLMAYRFGILHTKICIDPQKATFVTLATCMLHNFLRKTIILT